MAEDDDKKIKALTAAYIWLSDGWHLVEFIVGPGAGAAVAARVTGGRAWYEPVVILSAICATASGIAAVRLARLAYYAARRSQHTPSIEVSHSGGLKGMLTIRYRGPVPTTFRAEGRILSTTGEINPAPGVFDCRFITTGGSALTVTLGDDERADIILADVRQPEGHPARLEIRRGGFNETTSIGDDAARIEIRLKPRQSVKGPLAHIFHVARYGESKFVVVEPER